MTVKEFIEIIRQPYTISSAQARELDEIVKEFPYFQAARVLQLKLLHSEGNYRYSKALKLAAVHVTDRTVLFNFINSKDIIPDFSTIRSDFERISKVHERKEAVEDNAPPKVSYIDNSPRNFRPTLPDPIFEEKIIPDELINHQELTDLFVPKTEQPTLKPEMPILVAPHHRLTTPTPAHYQSDTVAEKFKLIDKFLENNPKIEASKEYVSNVNLADEVKGDERQLMTETLAQVYVNQRKYKQAIQAYQILILKNPKKKCLLCSPNRKYQKITAK